jgi:hypothetical protein
MGVQDQKSTSPISTKCTARSRCLIARTARCPKNRSASEAKSFNPATPSNPAPSSAPPRARTAARRGIEAGGRSGNLQDRLILGVNSFQVELIQVIRSPRRLCNSIGGILSHGSLPSVAIADQAAARERRNHSSKSMRPRRASPNGTSECSSTRPPQYRASGSRTTSRGSPTAFR